MLSVSLQASRVLLAFMLGAAGYMLQSVYYVRSPPSFLIYPLLWMLAAMLLYPVLYKGLERNRIIGSFAASIVVLILLVGAGMALGMALSPYTHTPLAVALNLYRVIPVVLGVEALRTYLARRTAVNKDKGRLTLNTWRLIALSLVFMLPQFTLSQLQLGLMGQDKLPGFLSMRLIPGFAESLTLTVMAAYTGFAAPAVMALTLHSFEVLSPLLPDIPWSLAGMVGALAYMAGLFTFLSLTEPFPNPFKRGELSLRSLALPAVLSLIILAPTGVFGYRASVIMSSSMKPTLNVGDIVVVRLGAKPANGSIAEFYHDGEYLVHRVIGIEDGGKLYQTKGDAVREPDPFKTPSSMIVGVVVMKIPMLGWATIYLREAASFLLKHVGMLNTPTSLLTLS